MAGAATPTRVDDAAPLDTDEIVIYDVSLAGDLPIGVAESLQRTRQADDGARSDPKQQGRAGPSNASINRGERATAGLETFLAPCRF